MIEFPQVSTFAVIIIGWFVINYQHNKRETRKELRCAIDSFKELAYVIEDDAVAYHTQNTENKNVQARKLRQLIDRLEFQLDLNRLAPVSVLSKAIIQLRQAVTLKNFDTYEYRELSLDDEVVQDIHYAIDNLVNRVEYHFRVRYPL